MCVHHRVHTLNVDSRGATWTQCVTRTSLSGLEKKYDVIEFCLCSRIHAELVPVGTPTALCLKVVLDRPCDSVSQTLYSCADCIVTSEKDKPVSTLWKTNHKDKVL